MFTTPFHLVTESVWPLMVAMQWGLLAYFGVCHMLFGHYMLYIICVFSLILLTSYSWGRDISREGSICGDHGMWVASGLRLSMLLFILSEVMLFFSFFWGYFTFFLVPDIELGSCWPPVGCSFWCLDSYSIPLLNTAVLVCSGISVTLAHHAAMEGRKMVSLLSLAFTIFLGGYFTLLQVGEYAELGVSISDSCLGSVFFVATGFHGAHVIVGSVLLAICLYRMYLGHFSSSRHVGYECAIWYWHFVDVVWLFLYFCFYCWGMGQ